MALRYSCFISYRHASGREATGFVEQIRESLHSALEIELGKPLYFDERLSPGDYVSDEIAKSMCESACLVVLYWAGYFDKIHTYCAREFRAMQLLEEQRLRGSNVGLGPHGLIIPLVLRREDVLPAGLEDRFYVDFTNFSLAEPELWRHPEYIPKIRRVAKRIAECYRALEHSEECLSADCTDFKLPTNQDIQTLLDSVPTGQIEFPLREDDR